MIEIPQKRFLTVAKKKPSGSLLPPEYQQVTYIEGTGTQYIDTGYKMNRASQAELSFEITGYSTQISGFFGALETYLAYAIYTSGTDRKTLRGIFAGNPSAQGSVIDLETIILNKLYNVSMNRAEIKVNDNIFSVATGIATSSSINALIFGRNVASEKGKMRLYSCKMYEDDVLIRDFVPCYRKADGVIGVYDLCNSVNPTTNTPFYTNAGTGTFLKGADI